MSERSARGLVLARTPFREHDLRVDLLLEDGDRVEALAPSGQRSKQRFAGGLTPLALHRFGLTPSARGLRLDDARIERPWPSLLTDLARQSAALAAVGVARELAAPTPGDPTCFLLLAELCDRLASAAPPDPSAALVRFALEVLAHTGHALVLERCVRCGAPAPPERLVTVDHSRGGVVCRACGGAPYRLTAADRAALVALGRGEDVPARAGLVTVLASVASGVMPASSAVLARVDEVLAPRNR